VENEERKRKKRGGCDVKEENETLENQVMEYLLK
jgi:hypothetical protein